MPDNLLLNPNEFKIDELDEDGGKGAVYCKRLIEKWTPQLETEMLEAFIRLYYDGKQRILAGNRIARRPCKTHRHGCYTLCSGRRSICQKQNRPSPI